MLAILVECHSRKLGGNTLLIPFEEILLASNACRELGQMFLSLHLERPKFLSAAQEVKMVCVNQAKFVQTGSGGKKVIANAIA